MSLPSKEYQHRLQERSYRSPSRSEQSRGDYDGYRSRTRNDNDDRERREYRRSDYRTNDKYGRSRGGYESRSRFDDRTSSSYSQSRPARSRSPKPAASNEKRRTSRFTPANHGRGGWPDPEYLAERWAQREAKKFSIWALSPSSSADEEDRLEEARILAEQQRRLDELAGKATYVEADISSDDMSDNGASLTGSESAARPRKSSKKRSHSSKTSHHRPDDRKKEKRSSKHKGSRSKRSEDGSKRRRNHRHQSSRYDSDSSKASDNDSGSGEHSDRRTSSRAASRKNRPDKDNKVDAQEPKSVNGDTDGYSSEEVGPMPSSERIPALTERSFGGALLPGEGSAMAAYVQSGERIPRRGEIGVDQNMIERLENSGYVMSGNRHRRMDAVRQRKESQIITAEEKRKMLLETQEERRKKESQIIAEFRDMLSKKK
ncbi:hypothetical protein GGI25_003373 [Coemansia spiralis]|uniref:NF-kappa-B-activating protein C-terminal domain-containing protein n=2 Tax=Coemansia TaxID=4863 RepID=A0A9W8G780_9FUNG|nr:hypothetical protein EDC05_003762 [Coemansia umbellata]KAJ2621691.1 hypothetical protein GGI26_003899 [Coemansia sp. RSA 1358]KAJ2676838.1 hypothetical protein GGI25_003373 [Coemansia spiralis]